MADLNTLPANLPVPADDGAADRLVGRPAPPLRLPGTDGERVSLSELGPGRTVLYVYPRSGRPGVDLPTGWDDIPGARGCTPEACDFRDHHQDLIDAGADRVFGLSSQDTEYQRELVDRLDLPFPLLSDADLSLADLLGLPTFRADGMTLFKRLTLVIRDGLLEHAFYPVFPPDQHARQVLSWLHSRDAGTRQRNARWLSSRLGGVREALPPAPATVVELGCGTEGGFVPGLLQAGYDAVGVDPMAPAGAKYRQVEIERFTTARQLDALVACTSLHHVHDLADVLSTACTLVRPQGTIVVIEWDWERFDEGTARWCFERLPTLPAGTGHDWLQHLRDTWAESGGTWADHLRAWATQAGIHPADAVLAALDARLERRSLSREPYFFADLEGTSEADEQAAIDAGLIQPAGICYVGAVLS